MFSGVEKGYIWNEWVKVITAGVCKINILLKTTISQFQANFPFLYPPEIYQKTSGFLIFSGVIETVIVMKWANVANSK